MHLKRHSTNELPLKLAISLVMFFCLLTDSRAQDEDYEDFDISMFEEVGESVKAFCSNKVLGQSPSPLISFGFDYQGSSTLTTSGPGTLPPVSNEIENNTGFRFAGNFPVLSRSNILVNLGINYVQLGYNFSDDVLLNPLPETLENNSLKWFNTNLTVFKPLNEKRFLLFQLGAELNGDYNFNQFQSLSTLRIPAAFIYGFKPNDNLMWGPGISRTYLGGALNLLPVVYYYHTFDNEKWGIEALFPARIQTRYRFNSRNLLMMGYQVEGATYRLNSFGETSSADPLAIEDNVELRRSEIRAGITYNRGLNDFIWVGVQAGYRINYSFNVDEGEFFRGFDDTGYLMENELTNTLYFQFTLSLVSP